jgi:hypothetical protein
METQRSLAWLALAFSQQIKLPKVDNKVLTKATFSSRKKTYSRETPSQAPHQHSF